MEFDRTRLLGKPPIIPEVCEGDGEQGMVSVIIPTYNRGYIIGKTIDSVLAQTYRPIELIIVDDGSSDETQDVVRSYGSAVQYIYQKNAGLAAARNTGLSAARGEFIAFQDSDDIWLPWKLEAQMYIMRKHTELAFVWTDMTAIDPNGRIVRDKHLSTMYSVFQRIDADQHLPHSEMLSSIWPGCPENLQSVTYRYGDIYSAMFLGNLVHPPTALIRRQHVNRTGGLDLTYAWTCEDYEFFWRVSENGLGALLEAPSMLYRIDADDQLTKPHLLLYIARGNLFALQRRYKNQLRTIELPQSTIRRHLANAHLWVANEELVASAGQKRKALEHFWRSLCLNPFPRDHVGLFMLRLITPKSLKAMMQSVKRLLVSKASYGSVIVSDFGEEMTYYVCGYYSAADGFLPGISCLLCSM